MSQAAIAEPRRTRLGPGPSPDPGPGTPPPLDAESPTVAPVSRDGLAVTEEDYWREYYLESDVHYEWNNGRLEEKPVSDYETFLVYQWFMALLSHFLTATPIAKLVALEMGFRLPLPTGTVIRKPDFGVVRNDNPRPLLPLDCSYHGVFDLCVEALSDRERRGIERDAVVKRAEYGAGGVPEYYILHREPAHRAFLTRTAAGVYVPLEPDAGLIRSAVLPGFQFRLDDLCRRPEHTGLRDDPVYAAYLFPGWRAAEERALEETQARREEASARAAAEQRAQAEAEARRAAEARARDAEEALANLRARLADVKR